MHRFEEMLVSEVGLEKIHAKVFLHITTNGKSTVAKVASDLGITKNDALQAIESLMKLGALIDMPEGAGCIRGYASKVYHRKHVQKKMRT